MQKAILAVVISCGVWAGTQTAQMNCASAQASMSPSLFSPLTNQLGFPLAIQPGFTNTLGPPADLSAAQVGDVATLLLSLQTNVELTLPALATMTSNATLVNLSFTNGFNGFAAPIVSGQSGAFLPPTGAASGANTPQQIGFAVTLGTNRFAVDQQTFQALLALRTDLEQTLPVLQALNGTTPPPTNTIITSTFANPIPAVTNFSTGHLIGGFTTPLTNQPQVLTAPSPF